MKKRSVEGRRPVTVIAAAAAAVTVPTGHEAAQAQSIAPPTFTPKTTISFEGGFLFSNYSPANIFPGGVPTVGKLGTTTSNGSLLGNKNYGGYGAISFGQDINPLYDWRVSTAFNAFQNNNRNASTTVSGVFIIDPFTETNSVTATDKFHYLTFDFDVGRRWEKGNLQLRTFAGLRALRTSDSFTILSTDVTEKLGTSSVITSMSGDSHFTGVGPRIGLDMFYGSTFGIVGSVSAAAIWGIRDSHFTTNVFNVKGGVSTMSQSRSAWVENLSGSLGFNWQFAPNAYLVLGYKADAWWNIRDNFSYTGIEFNRDKDILSHGPFLRVTVRQ